MLEAGFFLLIFLFFLLSTFFLFRLWFFSFFLDYFWILLVFDCFFERFSCLIDSLVYDFKYRCAVPSDQVRERERSIHSTDLEWILLRIKHFCTGLDQASQSLRYSRSSISASLLFVSCILQPKSLLNWMRNNDITRKHFLFLSIFRKFWIESYSSNEWFLLAIPQPIFLFLFEYCITRQWQYTRYSFPNSKG